MNTLKPIIFSMLACGVQQQSFAAAESADQIHYSVYDSPQPGGTASVAFDWRDCTGFAASISYGTVSGSYAFGKAGIAQLNPPPTSSSTCFFREIELAGLNPGTTYYYSIADGPEHSFRTPPLRGNTDAFLVYAVADLGSSLSYSQVMAVQDLLAGAYGNGIAHLVLMLGDLSYADIGKGPDGVNAFYNEVMVWSKNTAFMPQWGNHEWEPPTTTPMVPDDFSNYVLRHALPNSQSAAGASTDSIYNYSGGEDWYWFYWGSVLFISIPEPYNTDTWGKWPPSATASKAWSLKADQLMAAAQADPTVKFIVTFGHRAAYSSNAGSGGDTNDGDAKLKAVLDGLGKYSKYVLNLSGHAHYYQRSIALGASAKTVHAVAGTGHTNPAPDSTVQPTWSLFRTEQPGALQLLFAGNRITGRFICAVASDVCPKAGTVIDSFTIGSNPLSVEINQPSDKTVLSGNIKFSATITDTDPNQTVVEAAFKLINGTSAMSLGKLSEGTVIYANGKYSIVFNSAARPNGNYQLSFFGKDTDGNIDIKTICLSINNSATASGSLTFTPAP